MKPFIEITTYQGRVVLINANNVALVYDYMPKGTTVSLTVVKLSTFSSGTTANDEFITATSVSEIKTLIENALKH